MIIIIDGYNVLKQYAPGLDVAHAQRTRFIAQLARYAHCKKHTIIVVFDGGPYQWVSKELIKNITVVYSGEHKTADDIIKGYIEEHQRHDALLVSSDRELNVYAQEFGITSIDSRDFYYIVHEGIASKKQAQKSVHNTIIKLTDDLSPEVDALMKSMVQDVPIKKENFYVHDLKNTSKKMSKEERTLLIKLKKL